MIVALLGLRMSSRSLRRALQPHMQSAEDTAAEEESEPVTKPSLFHLLQQEQPSADSAEDLPQDEVEPLHQEDPDNSGSRKTKTKKKQKNKKKKSTEEDKEDEILDQILSAPAIAETVPSSSKEQHILRTSPQFFNPKKELTGMFGSSVLNALDQEDSDTNLRTKHKGKRQQTLSSRNKLIQRRTHLVEPKNSWPPFPAIEAKDIRFIKSTDQEGDDVFDMTFGDEYQRQQKEFVSCVETLDPQAIAFMVAKYPFHVDSLLQMSEIYKQHGEMKEAADLVERAIFRIETSFPANIPLMSGHCPLDTVSARSVFVALFRYINYLARQGCTRTALEFCKLLLSFSRDDPMCILLSIDHFALRSKEYHYLLRLAAQINVRETDVSDLGDSRCKVQLLPNFAYSIALCKFFMECDSQTELSSASWEISMERLINFNKNLVECTSKELLCQALFLYPEMVKPLLSKASERELGKSSWQAVLMHPLFSDLQIGGVIEKLCQVFVTRNHMMWNSERVLQWLLQTASELVTQDSLGEHLSMSRALKDQLFDKETYLSKKYRNISVVDQADIVEVLPEDDGRRARVAERVVAAGGIALDLQTHPLRAFFMSLLPWVHINDSGEEKWDM